MSDLKSSWKQTGVGLGHAFRDLGKSLLKTGATAVRKVDQWANSEDYSENQPQENNSENK